MTELATRPVEGEIYADAGNGVQIALMAERYFEGIYDNFSDPVDRALILKTLPWATPDYDFTQASSNYRLAMGINEQGEGIEAVILRYGKPAGLTGIDFSESRRSPEVNIWLGPRHHGQGVGKLALHAFMTAAKQNNPDIDQFEYHILPRNIASQQLVKSLGGQLRAGEVPGAPFEKKVGKYPKELYFIWDVPLQ